MTLGIIIHKFSFCDRHSWKRQQAIYSFLSIMLICQMSIFIWITQRSTGTRNCSLLSETGDVTSSLLFSEIQYSPTALNLEGMWCQTDFVVRENELWANQGNCELHSDSKRIGHQTQELSTWICLVPSKKFLKENNLWKIYFPSDPLSEPCR